MFMATVDVVVCVGGGGDGEEWGGAGLPSFLKRKEPISQSASGWVLLNPNMWLSVIFIDIFFSLPWRGQTVLINTLFTWRPDPSSPSVFDLRRC